MTVAEIIKELDYLRERADYRSRMLIEDGREIPDVDRAKSAAYADAYAFAIMRLKECAEGGEQ